VYDDEEQLLREASYSMRIALMDHPSFQRKLPFDN
jgi:hypothetical protein